MYIREFYSELGKLLYSIADSDGNVRQKEKDMVKKLVRRELLSLEDSTDEFGTDSALYTEFEFDIVYDAVAKPEIAFESFINFIEEHQTAVNEKMIRAARKTAVKLADSYHHTNKRERVLLRRLNEKLDELVKNKTLVKPVNS